MDAFGCLLDDFGRHVATEVHFDDDFVSIQLVVTPHGRLAPLRGTAAARAIGEHRVAAIVEDISERGIGRHGTDQFCWSHDCHHILGPDHCAQGKSVRNSLTEDGDIRCNSIVSLRPAG